MLSHFLLTVTVRTDHYHSLSRWEFTDTESKTRPDRRIKIKKKRKRRIIPEIIRIIHSYTLMQVSFLQRSSGMNFKMTMLQILDDD